MVNDADILDRLRHLESRLRLLEDEKEIRALLSRHDYYFDCMRDEDWLALWAEDGAFDLVSVVNYPDGSRRELVQRYQGSDELRAFVTHPEGHHRQDFYGHSMHCASNNLVIEVQDDTATATSYSLLYQERDGVVQLLSAANNHWTLARRDGAWRLVERSRRQIGSPHFKTNIIR